MRCKFFPYGVSEAPAIKLLAAIVMPFGFSPCLARIVISYGHGTEISLSRSLAPRNRD